MKNIVIVTCHPYAGSFCHALMMAVKTGAEAAGKTVTVIDLEADGFDPVMHSADLIGFLKHQAVDEQAKAYIQTVKAADQLVLIFPIWWELMPAMMKGFIDKVIFPGETFTYSKSLRGMAPLIKAQRTTVMTTMNTPKLLYRFVFGQAIQRALVRGTLKKMGLKHVTWQKCAMVKKSTPAKREAWLNRAKRIGAQS